MNFKHITSRDNAIFKHLKKLAEHARERQSAGETLLDGVHLITDYIQTFGAPALVIIPEGKTSREATHLLQQLADVDTVMFPTPLFAELSPVVTSSGILALVAIPQLDLPTAPDFALILEDIQDPGNLGSLLRTALGAGVDVVYLSKACTDVWSPKSLRGGQGAQFHLPVVTNAIITEVIQQFAGNTYATTLQGASLFSQDLTGAAAFIIGNEGAGLSPQTIQAANCQISIPLHPRLESLNAAAAAAICLFERRRQLTGQRR